MKDKDKRRLQQFAAHLTKLREEKGLSQRALSSRCEVDFGKISKIENGKANLVVTTLIELADGLGVHPRELLNIVFD
jgi:transcriptional regulator with XRE-family HTH domain